MREQYLGGASWALLKAGEDRKIQYECHLLGRREAVIERLANQGTADRQDRSGEQASQQCDQLARPRRLVGQGRLADPCCRRDALLIQTLINTRVLVFGSGQITQELGGETLTEENIIAGSARAEVGRQKRAKDVGVAAIAGQNRIRKFRTNDFAPVVLLLAAIFVLGIILGFESPYFWTSQNLSDLLFLAVP
jgi:hypothetical protein